MSLYDMIKFCKKNQFYETLDLEKSHTFDEPLLKDATYLIGST